MARYIDADAVLHAIEGMREAEWAKQEYLIPNDIIAKAILDAAEDTVNYEIPAADVAPVVRCKDCKHCRNLPHGMCYLNTEPYDNERGYKGEAVCVEADDFCSYGEKAR